MADCILDQDPTSTIPSTGGAAKASEQNPTNEASSRAAQPLARDFNGRLEDDLNDAAHWLTLMQWIGAARGMLEGLAEAARHDPQLTPFLRSFDVFPTDPEWTARETEALRYLHQAAEASVRNAQRRLGLR